MIPQIKAQIFLTNTFSIFPLKNFSKAPKVLSPETLKNFQDRFPSISSSILQIEVEIGFSGVLSTLSSSKFEKAPNFDFETLTPKFQISGNQFSIFLPFSDLYFLFPSSFFFSIFHVTHPQKPDLTLRIQILET